MGVFTCSIILFNLDTKRLKCSRRLKTSFFCLARRKQEGTHFEGVIFLITRENGDRKIEICMELHEGKRNTNE